MLATIAWVMLMYTIKLEEPSKTLSREKRFVQTVPIDVWRQQVVVAIEDLIC